MLRHSQEQYDDWFHWSDPAQDPYFQSAPRYSNPETRIVVDWLQADQSRVAKLTKWVQKQSSKTYDMDGVHAGLVERLKGELWSYADRLGAPYSELLYYALVNVEWDAVAGLITANMGWAPAKQPGEEHLEKALGLIPEEPPPQAAPEPVTAPAPAPPADKGTTTPSRWEFSPNFT
jgi:hypothetical protein